jgi:hypothetical protein
MHGGDKGMLFKGGKVKSVKVEDEKDGGLAKTFKVVMIAASTNQCGKVYGQGMYVCLRKGCQVKHQRAVDLARGRNVMVVAKHEELGFASPTLEVTKMDTALIVEMLDKWVEIGSLIEAVYDPDSDNKVTLDDLDQLAGFKASFNNFCTPFKGKKMEEAGL